MPHDIMNTIHEAGMPGSHHWLYWAVVAAVFAVIIFLVLWFGLLRNKRTK